MKRNIINIILILLTIAIAGCGDKPLFTELADNRIKVIIKATYESNSPRPWEIDFSNPNSWDDSVDDLNLSTPEITTEVNDNLIIPPTKFMMDIAEMRVSDGSFSQRFANYRKTYSQGLNKNASLFNGTGVIYKNDDVRPGFEWRFIKVYLRKMLFDSAKIYYYNDNNVIDGIGTWSFVENDKDIFAEEDVEGLNFIIYQINSYYDSLLYQASSINRIFPLSIKIDDPFIFDNELPETVIEIRFVIKNFIKKYELDYFPDGKERRVKHFYAPADWLRDVKAGRVYSSIKAGPMNDCEVMGRNIIATARTYIPGQTVTIKGKADNSECYVIAINGNHDISEYQITDAERQRPEETDGKPLDEPKVNTR